MSDAAPLTSGLGEGVGGFSVGGFSVATSARNVVSGLVGGRGLIACFGSLNSVVY